MTSVISEILQVESWADSGECKVDNSSIPGELRRSVSYRERGNQYLKIEYFVGVIESVFSNGNLFIGRCNGN